MKQCNCDWATGECQGPLECQEIESLRSQLASAAEEIALLQARGRLAAQSAAPVGEPVAWQFRQRSGVGHGPQRHAPWCDWCNINRYDYEGYLRRPNPLIEVRCLYAAPAPIAPQVREEIINECADIASKYDDCGGQFIADKIRELALSEKPGEQP